jgi:hypothetical protein
MRHIGPNELRLANLLPRFKSENNGGVEIQEVILATNPTTEGGDSKLHQPFAQTPRPTYHAHCDGNACGR